MNKHEMLQKLKLGDRVAENEAKSLPSYFLPTVEWGRLYDDEVDLIKGSKGSGKSALYVGLANSKSKLKKRKIIICEAENPTGASAFSRILANPRVNPDEIRDVWKLYMIGLLFGDARNKLGFAARLLNHELRAIYRSLVNSRVLGQGIGLDAVFNHAYDAILNKDTTSSESGLTVDPTSLVPGFSRKREFRPKEQSVKTDFLTLDNILRKLSEVYEKRRCCVWLIFDRLDVLLESDPVLESLVVKQLFRAYSDMRPYQNIKVKIFVRDDIWKNVIQGGFKEASHLTREMRLEWDSNRILNLVISRLVSNEDFCRLYNVNKKAILEKIDLQRELFYRVFPQRVEGGDRKSLTFDWIINRVTDGNGIFTPREIIHFIQELRLEQLQRIARGDDKSEGEQLFGANCFKAAWKAVSKEKFEKVLLNEYPSLHDSFLAFEGKHAEYTKDKLIEILGQNAEQKIQKLCEIGFFSSVKATGTFKIPFIYQPCLSIVLGKE